MWLGRRFRPLEPVQYRGIQSKLSLVNLVSEKVNGIPRPIQSGNQTFSSPIDTNYRARIASIVNTNPNNMMKDACTTDTNFIIFSDGRGNFITLTVYLFCLGMYLIRNGERSNKIGPRIAAPIG